MLDDDWFNEAIAGPRKWEANDKRKENRLDPLTPLIWKLGLISHKFVAAL